MPDAPFLKGSKDPDTPTAEVDDTAIPGKFPGFRVMAQIGHKLALEGRGIGLENVKTQKAVLAELKHLNATLDAFVARFPPPLDETVEEPHTVGD